ncbi:MAG: type 2 isopentenyl-diphosphate Delta-isomerase [Chloroflexi bacterium]|nr:type 2 isopentenyl-diphosphate Delta-isomerase [Chloroflexota bacterium]
MHSERKRDHLRICLEEDVRSAVTNGLERYRLLHCALPEMALADVCISTTFLGHTLAAPLLISAMTGGTPEAREINLRLAAAAQELGLAMGLGSQRVGLSDPAIMATYRVRSAAPDILLLANLGAVQLNYGYGQDECRRAVESVGADALVLHLNPLQETLQPEGNTDFARLLGRIADVCRSLPCPVIVKEVGWGLSAQVAAALAEAGVAALDIGGAGGTSWSEVERHRTALPADAEVAAAFVDWGIPTADSLVQVRRALPDLPLIASGGLTTGVEMAKCLALGAQLCGMARPLLRAAADSTDALRARLDVILRQLRISMFCVGARSLSELDASRIARRE